MGIRSRDPGRTTLPDLMLNKLEPIVSTRKLSEYPSAAAKFWTSIAGASNAEPARRLPSFTGPSVTFATAGR